MGIALYTFQAVDESELNLTKGDIIHVLQSGAPDAWWKGQVHKKQGHFPGNYIKVLPTKAGICSRFGIPNDDDDDGSTSQTTEVKNQPKEEQQKEEKQEKKNLPKQSNTKEQINNNNDDAQKEKEK